MNIYDITKTYILNEANVYNVKQPYNDVSIDAFIKQFIPNISTPEMQNIFAKKMQKLLLNDARFHNAVRDLPPDAPDWAKTAAEAGELVYFIATEELNDLVNNITHAIAAMEEDAAQTANKDQQSFAKKEMSGLGKVENLDVWNKKSNEYFKRGSRTAGRDEAGLKHIYDAGHGYNWYLIETEDAARRQGKTLQNCIGSYWTLGKAKREGFALVVLRDTKGNAYVAGRIQVAKKEMYEMKGKNNKPPVEKYMPYVIKFANHMKLSVSDSGSRDFVNAGYFYHEKTKKWYSKSEAIRDLVQTEELGKIAFGLSLRRVVVENKELFYMLYEKMAQMLGATNYNKSSLSTNGVSIYEARDKNNLPIITGLVQDMRLSAIKRHSATVTESFIFLEDIEGVKDALTDKAGREFISELYRRKLIDSIDGRIARTLFWQEKMAYNEEEGKYMPREDSTNTVDSGKGLHKWEHITDRNILNQIKGTLYGADGSGGDNTLPGDFNFKDVKDVYTTTVLPPSEDRKGNSVILVLLNMKDGSVFPIHVMGEDLINRGTGYSDLQSNTYHKSVEVDNKTVDSLVSLANKQKLNIPRFVRINHGIIKDGDTWGRAKTTPKDVEGGQVFDLTKYDGGDRLAAIYGISNDPSVSPGKADKFDIQDELGEVARKWSGRGSYGQPSETSPWGGKKLKDAYEHLFGGGTPDHIYAVELGYGVGRKHKTLLLTDDKTIVKMDTGTGSHEWQSWDDYDQVAKQLNVFAEKHGLTFGKNSTKDHREFREKGGKIFSATELERGRLQKNLDRGRFGKDAADSIEFEGGHTLSRMSPQEQGTWVRQSLKRNTRVPGEAWLLKDSIGETAGIVQVVNGKIAAVYNKKEDEYRQGGVNTPDQPNRKTKLSAKVAGLVRGAAEAMNWDIKPDNQFVIKKNSKEYYALANMRHQSKRRYHGGTQAEKRLVDAGMVTVTRPSGRLQIFTINPQGIAAFTGLRGGDDNATYNYVENTSPTALHADFKMPEHPGVADQKFTFSDKSVMQRMSPAEQAKWMRKDLKADTVKGDELWKIQKEGQADIDNVIVINNNRVTNSYSKSGGGKTANSDKASKADMLPYIKKAAEHMGWDVSPRVRVEIKSDSRQHQLLRYLNQRGRTPRTRALGAIGLNVGGLAGWDNTDAPAHDRILYDLGLVGMEKTGRSFGIDITRKGRDVLAKLERNEDVDVGDGNIEVTSSPPKKETKVDAPSPSSAPAPDPAADGARPARAPRAPGAEKKSDAALRIFTQMATDNDAMPTRSEFMNILRAAPFNMTDAGAGTYFYTTKKKYAALNESFSAKAALELLLDSEISAFDSLFLI